MDQLSVVNTTLTLRKSHSLDRVALNQRGDLESHSPQDRLATQPDGDGSRDDTSFRGCGFSTTIRVGYRVQHNRSRGPYEGGLLYHPDADIDEMRALASSMTWKTAVIGVPFGHAKGDVQVGAWSLSDGELERLTRASTRAIGAVIGDHRDIPASGMYTGARTMAWILDEYAQLEGWTSGVVTGKPVPLGGSLGRESATGRGCIVIVDEIVEEWGHSHPSVEVNVFGTVGSWVTRTATARGYRVVAVSNQHCTLFRESGLDIDQLVDHVARHGAIDGFEHGGRAEVLAVRPPYRTER